MAARNNTAVPTTLHIGLGCHSKLIRCVPLPILLIGGLSRSAWQLHQTLGFKPIALRITIGLSAL